MCKEKTKPIDKRARRYGEFVVKFANANSVDTACTGLFEYMQEEFNFSDKFLYKAKSFFPYMNRIISKINNIDERILPDYREYMVKHSRFDYPFDSFLLHKDTISRYGDSLVLEIYQILVDDSGPIHVCDTISGFKNQLHCLLLGISKGRDLNEYEILNKDIRPYEISLLKGPSLILKGFLVLYNLFIHNTSKYQLSDMGQIVKSKPFDEITYLEEMENSGAKHPVGQDWSGMIEYTLPEDWLEIIRNPVIFLLIEFLETENGKNYIKSCEQCDVIFFAKKLDDRTKYCPSCSPKSKISRERRNELQRRSRARLKQEKIEKERELRIDNYMKNLDCTREEAVRIIESDLKV